MGQRVKELCNTIKEMKEANRFKNYINHITFPHFRNLDEGTKITFDFPLSIFVGHNGAGKSSTLHALYGAPYDSTPNKFWFETNVDPIINLRHRFFYEHLDDNGVSKEVMKTRIKKEGKPDYWETSRPLVNDGMRSLGGKRNPPIKKNVVYLDFRSELSAFDKYFYFGELKRNKSPRKQDYIRNRSKFLKKVLDETKDVYHNPKGKEQNNPLRSLSVLELKWVSFILGKDYKEAKLLEHAFYKQWGYTLMFKTSHASYSDAFAGSGETAVTRLVLDILNAPNYSFILLDEPEVSLHPGAQKRLKVFLLEQIKLKQHQVIVSTHSPHLVNELPPEAIKVFRQKQDDGKFVVSNKNLPEQAFHYIEHEVIKRRIVVEDSCAKKLLEAFIKKEFDDATLNMFDIVFYPGGASNIQSDHIKFYAQEGINAFVIFDGDQRYNADIDYRHQEFGDVTQEKLKELVKIATDNDQIKFKPDGGNQEKKEVQEIQMMKDYLDYYRQKVFFFPLEIPEDIFWSEESAKILCESQCFTYAESDFSSLKDSKAKFYKLSTITNMSITACYTFFINRWLSNNESDEYMEIKSIVERIRDFPNE